MTEDSSVKKQRYRVGKEKSLRKTKIRYFQIKKLIETPCESNINTVFGEHVSLKNCTFWYCCR